MRKRGEKRLRMGMVGIMLLLTTAAVGHPINDYYKTHKDDQGMEARTVPPKLASLLIDEDYPEAIEVLQAMTSLKYLNYHGEKKIVRRYAEGAISAKGNYVSLLNEREGLRKISVFGIRKKGTVRKLMAIVESKTEFILLIGKGRLTDQQIASLPALSREI